MSFLIRLFKKPAEEDYETILSTLSRDVQSRQQKLADIRLRERRATLLATLYTLAAYILYVSLWYFQIPVFSGVYGRRNGVEKAIAAAPVVIGPIVVLFIRRIVQLWYSRKEAAEEKTLQQLLKQQRSKVEEIKKKTNYYSTRDLLSRYDDQTPMNTPRQQSNQGLRQRMNAGTAATPHTPVSAGVARPPVANANGNVPPPPPQGMINPALNGLSPSPFIATPTRKQWYDKLADALLGDDDQQGPPSSRYALICEKCFKHNGLVKESMWEDAQYICPKCGHFNASARSKREQGRRSLSPNVPSNGSASSPSSPSPIPKLKPSKSSSPVAKPTVGSGSDDGEGDEGEDRMDED